jgi:drug/metabolite transporter (DMT)-like permease
MARKDTCSRQRRIAAGILVIISATYGISGVTTRELQRDLGVWQQVALLNWGVLAAACLIFWVTQRTITPTIMSSRVRIELMGRAVVGRVFGSMLYIEACSYAPLGNVGWLSALPTSVMFAWILYGERMSRREVGSIILGFFGAVLVIGPASNDLMSFGYGELCALGSTFAGGLALILGRDSVKQTDTWSATIWVALTTAITATSLAFIIDGGLVFPSLSRLPILSVAIAIFLLSNAGSLFAYAHLSASTASAILSLGAVWTLATGYALYGEIPTALAVAGGVMIMWSAYWSSALKCVK